MTMASHTRTARGAGVDLAYVEQGRGEPVVFVHGSVNDYRAWSAQLAPFGELYRAVAYSRRYHWPNPQPRPGTTYTVAEHVADLASLIESLGLVPAHIVGSSYGALTALTLAVERPDLVRSLVLGEPPLLPWLARLPDGPALLDAFLTNAFGPAREAFDRGETEAGVRLFIDGVIGPGAFDRLPPGARAMMLENAAAEGIETSTPPDQYFPALSTEDVSRIDVPTLLVQGDVSPAMFGRITDELARVLPRAERTTIPAASHGMHAQNPAAYTAAVLAFLAAHGAMPTTP
jgi:non-heme chloroperoxidase